eukprot:2566022-Karenia_brevis.AAC.1
MLDFVFSVAWAVRDLVASWDRRGLSFRIHERSFALLGFADDFYVLANSFANLVLMVSELENVLKDSCGLLLSPKK